MGGRVSEGGTILCVDDDSTVLRALRSVLSNHFGAGLEMEFAESGEEALEIAADLQAQERELSVVISDFMMPGLRGDELLVRLHQMSPNTLTILLTGQSDLTGVKRAINEANLYRFLEKPFNNEDIVLTVRSALRAYAQERDLVRQNEVLRQMNAKLESIVEARTQELIEKNRELEVLAVTDRLTGLFNRRKLDQLLEDEVVRRRRYGTGFAVVIVDLDHFKRVNDTFGHAVGDVVLKDLAQILRDRTREADALARLGGEEFVIVCRNAALDGTVAMAEKVREAVAAHDFPTAGHITASFGVATCREDDTAASLLARADAALYRAKANGRDRVEVAA